MATMTTRGQITIVDLNDGRTLNLTMEPNKVAKQVKNTDTKNYSPAWTTADPFILTPHLYVSGEGTTDIWANSAVSNRKFYINDTQITATSASSPDATYHCYVSSNKLYFVGNMDNSAYYNVKVVCEYTDPNTSLVTAANTTLSVTREDMASSAITLFMWSDGGDTFNKDLSTAGSDNDVDWIDIYGIMYRGGSPDITDVTYKWAKDGTYITVGNIPTSTSLGKLIRFYNAVVTSGTVTKGSEITYPTSTTEVISAPICRIHRDAVASFGVFKVEATDTDSSSATYNQTVADSMALYDATDPLQLEIEGSESLTRTNPSTSLKAKLYQGGDPIQTTSVYTSSKFGWTMYNAADTVIKTYNGSAWVAASSEASKTTGLYQNIAVNFSDVNGRCRIVCEAEVTI